MITDIEIENFKSIEKLDLKLGRVNIFIGENGSGKSNILEVIALAGAAAANKLDNEFLASRGIRVTRPEYMRAAFPHCDSKKEISIGVKYDNEKVASMKLRNDNLPYSKWELSFEKLSSGDNDVEIFSKTLNSISKNKVLEEVVKKETNMSFEDIIDQARQISDLLSALKLASSEAKDEKEKEDLLSMEQRMQRTWTAPVFRLSRAYRPLSEFIIFSPENSSLRTFQKEGQIEPLGINGEGLLKLLSFYSKKSTKKHKILEDVKESLKILNWFEDFNVSKKVDENGIEIIDRYLDPKIKDLSEKSANEGFLFLLFYFLLFNSEITPRFFAIDNIDASLNPKLCQNLIVELTKIARKNNKQAIFTTHNPAVLDGLNLDDDEQRLFVVSRDRNGKTKIKRVSKPVIDPGKTPLRLSELFLRGALGGLPKGF